MKADKITSSALLVVGLLGSFSSVLATGQKELIAPIFSQLTPLFSYIAVTETAGRSSVAEVIEYSVEGRKVFSANYFMSPDTMVFHETHQSFTPPHTGNGWARLLVPAAHEFHAVSVTQDIRWTASYFTTQLVRPASAFRLFGDVLQDAETGIAIVNPTESTQVIRVEFHRSYPLPRLRVAKEWTLEPLHKLSRFLSELIPMEDFANETGENRGVVRVSGKTVIAVGAIWYSRETSRSRSVWVTAESGER